MSENTKDIRKIRRKNAEIYPIYRMFSWDLLFFYSIEFLFYTITKKITASEVLIIKGIFLLFTIFMQIPAITITDFLRKKKWYNIWKCYAYFLCTNYDFVSRCLKYNSSRFCFCFRI